MELAQAVTAQRRTQLAARAAVDAKQRQTMERYREIKEAGEARVAVAQRDLDKAQTELRQTTAALDNAQTVLAERSTRLNEARGKLATLMSMTRDLLRLVKPVTDMRAAARNAAEQASLRLSSLDAAPAPTPAVSSAAAATPSSHRYTAATQSAGASATPAASPQARFTPSGGGYAATHALRVEERTGVPLRPDITAPSPLAAAMQARAEAERTSHSTPRNAAVGPAPSVRTPAGSVGRAAGSPSSVAEIEARMHALSAKLQL